LGAFILSFGNAATNGMNASAVVVVLVVVQHRGRTEE
jgi:hypothetical protein